MSHVITKYHIRRSLQSVLLLVGAILVIFVCEAMTARAADVEAFDILPTHIISLTNNIRSQAGHYSLVSDPMIQAVAQQKADLMAANNEFQHTLSDGTTSWSLLRTAGYQFQTAGENLAVHFSTADEVVNAWMQSPAHQRNILASEFTTIGIGVATTTWNGYEGHFIVQLFATPVPEAKTY